MATQIESQARRKNTTGVPTTDPAITHHFYASQDKLDKSKFQGKVRLLCYKSGCAITHNTRAQEAIHFSKAHYHGEEEHDSTLFFPIPYEVWLLDHGLRATSQATDVASFYTVLTGLPPFRAGDLVPITSGWEHWRNQAPSHTIDEELIGDGPLAELNKVLALSTTAPQNPSAYASDEDEDEDVAESSDSEEGHTSNNIPGTPTHLLRQLAQANPFDLDPEEAELMYGDLDWTNGPLSLTSTTTASAPILNDPTHALAMDQDINMDTHDDPLRPTSPATSAFSTWSVELATSMQQTTTIHRLQAQLHATHAQLTHERQTSIAQSTQFRQERQQFSAYLAHYDQQNAHLQRNNVHLRNETARAREAEREARRHAQRVVEQDALVWQGVLNTFTLEMD